MPSLKCVYAWLVDVKANDRTLFAKLYGQRKAHVAEADDGQFY